MSVIERRERERGRDRGRERERERERERKREESECRAEPLFMTEHSVDSVLHPEDG